MMKITLLLVLILNFVSLQCGTTNKSEPPIEINVTELISDYEKDESLATEKYQGQSVVLSGEISHFALIRGIIGVSVKSNNPESKEMIVCLIDTQSHPNDFSRLKDGLNGKFSGVVKIEPYNRSIYIKNCHFIE